MKLHNCDCGNAPEVSYKINDHNDFVVGCAFCDNRTPMCESITEAVSLWNQVYCFALPPYENETA